MFENVKRLRRSARVARTGAAIYLGYKRTQRKARKLEPAAAAQAWERRHEQAAERLYRLAVDLKGLYIKTGQFVGTRTDVAPAARCPAAARASSYRPPARRRSAFQRTAPS